MGAQGVLFVGAPRLGTALCPLPQPAHAQAKRGKAITLICKPTHMCQGRGIYLTKKVSACFILR